MVRIHAGEPSFRFNSLESAVSLFVQILYMGVAWTHRSPLILQDRSDEHGFETCKSMLSETFAAAGLSAVRMRLPG